MQKSAWYLSHDLPGVGASFSTAWTDGKVCQVRYPVGQLLAVACTLGTMPTVLTPSLYKQRHVFAAA